MSFINSYTLFYCTCTHTWLVTTCSHKIKISDLFVFLTVVFSPKCILFHPVQHCILKPIITLIARPIYWRFFYSEFVMYLHSPYRNWTMYRSDPWSLVVDKHSIHSALLIGTWLPHDYDNDYSWLRSTLINLNFHHTHILRVNTLYLEV